MKEIQKNVVTRKCPKCAGDVRLIHATPKSAWKKRNLTFHYAKFEMCKCGYVQNHESDKVYHTPEWLDRAKKDYDAVFPSLF